MLQALSTNLFSAANDIATQPAPIFPDLESGMWSNNPDTTNSTNTNTSGMEAEDNNYSYVLHTASTTVTGKHIVACSGSNNIVRIYDVSQPRGQLPLLATLDQTKFVGDSTITGLSFLEGGAAPGAVLTCSESGRLFLWDIRAPATPAVKFSCPPTGGMITSCVCSRGDGKVVAAGVGSSIRLWDVGTRKMIAVYEEAHTDDVTDIKFHPVAQSQLISGSLDGLICITDTSVPPTSEEAEDEGDTLVSGIYFYIYLFFNIMLYFIIIVLSVEHPISCFDFTDQQAKSIGVITCDEDFSIWSLESVNFNIILSKLLLIIFFA